MIVFLSAIFGIIQGLTEFLPISSSGHLLILHQLLTLDVSELSYDASIHLGTSAALIVFFWKDIRSLSIAFFGSIAKRNVDPIQRKLVTQIIVGCIPAAIVGYFGESFIENALRSPWIVSAMLVIGGLLFIAVERFSRKDRGISSLTLRDAVIVGISQCLAFIPGMSRSGITMTAGMYLHLSRQEAARFSFLLSIPVVVGAGIKKMLEVFQSGQLQSEALIYLIGIISSFIAGLAAISLLLHWTKKYSLKGFALYRFALAAAVIAVMLIA